MFITPCSIQGGLKLPLFFGTSLAVFSSQEGKGSIFRSYKPPERQPCLCYFSVLGFRLMAFLRLDISCLRAINLFREWNSSHDSPSVKVCFPSRMFAFYAGMCSAWRLQARAAQFAPQMLSTLKLCCWVMVLRDTLCKCTFIALSQIVVLFHKGKLTVTSGSFIYVHDVFLKKHFFYFESCCTLTLSWPEPVGSWATVMIQGPILRPLSLAVHEYPPKVLRTCPLYANKGYCRSVSQQFLRCWPSSGGSAVSKNKEK